MAYRNPPSNEQIAELLENIADLLEAQDGNPFRVNAYRRGAATVRDEDRSIAQMGLEGGRDALRKLPDVGDSLAGVILGYVHKGRSEMLDRLRGRIAPEELFDRVPGLGPELSRRIVAELGIYTLEDLETAAYNGRLEELEGFGEGRVQAVKDALAGILSRSAARRARERVGGTEAGSENGGELSRRPDVATILDVDAEYRRKAEAGELKTIAPRRFNPEGESWLPILHTRRGEWNFTALFSNTARAHERGATRDWVVIYYDRDGEEEDQCTVVTARRGPLEGRRIVRGREAACRRYYLDPQSAENRRCAVGKG
jgi:hypothetical protein